MTRPTMAASSSKMPETGRPWRRGGSASQRCRRTDADPRKRQGARTLRAHADARLIRLSGGVCAHPCVRPAAAP